LSKGKYDSLVSALLFKGQTRRTSGEALRRSPKRPDDFPAARTCERPPIATSHPTPMERFSARSGAVDGGAGEATPRRQGHMTTRPCIPLDGCRAWYPAQPGERPQNTNGVEHVHNSGPFGSRRDGSSDRFILFSLSTFRYKPENNSLTLASDTLILLPNKPPDHSHIIDHSPLKLFSAVFKVALFRFVSLLNSSNKEQLSFISICGCSSWK
jgi:hypothetical protein